MMTSFIPLLIVTSLYEIFIDGMEYDDTFHGTFILLLFYISVTVGSSIMSITDTLTEIHVR